MAANKRAAMRREKREREKLMNTKDTTANLMAKSFLAGKSEGMELACGLIFLALHEYYGFWNRRIMKLMDYISKESLKMDELPTKFNVDWYIQQLNEKCNLRFERDKSYEIK